MGKNAGVPQKVARGDGTSGKRVNDRETVEWGGGAVSGRPERGQERDAGSTRDKGGGVSKEK